MKPKGLQVHQFKCLADNYGFLVHDPLSKKTVAIDTPDAEAYSREARAKGWIITEVWNTHWHPDHAGGNEVLQSQWNCLITAPSLEVDRIYGVGRPVAGGNQLSLGAHSALVLDVGGHTLGHVAYYFPDQGVAFVGDTLFPLGCGRMFEGEPVGYWQSLCRLMALPADTLLYCSHEYATANLAFAKYIDPDCPGLQLYASELIDRQAKGQGSVPFWLRKELEANPFLRAGEPAIRTRMGCSDALSSFAALRRAKDQFVIG